LRPKILFITLRMTAMLFSLLFTQLLLPQLFWLVFWFGGAGLLFDLLYYLSGAAFVDDTRRYLLDLLAVPRYAMMWIYSLGIMAFQRIFRRRQEVWLRAGRQSE